MQSTMFGNKIQFHGIKSVYPVGERVACFFTMPEFVQPECGDWIGIFPVGWSSMTRDCLVRQMVRVEQLNGQYGQVEFETLPQFAAQQYYQFVYVASNGDYIVLGASTPFRFGGEQQQQQQEQQFLEQFVIKGGKHMPTTTGAEWFTGVQQPIIPTGPSTFGVAGGLFVESSEMQKLQNEIYNLEQGLWSQQQQQQQQVPTPFGWTKLNGQVGGNGNQFWQPKLAKVEQILKEKIKIEQAQRRLDQLCLLAQLKSCERHIVSVQKREPEIHSFLLKNKMQTKIAIFEQKVNQVIKMNPTGVSTPVEQYVRKYEQLLREKIQLDMEKRRVVLHKLRQTIRECERKLRELQTVNQEHLVSFHSLLKNQFEQFAGLRMYKQQQQQEQQQHFETIMGSFLFEQEKKTLNLVQAQRELTFLINEICGKLQEFEFESSGCYSSLRIPRISSGLMMFNSHPKLFEIVQLEKKIAEQKLRFKLKMLTGVPTRFVEQLARGVWFTPVVEKLRMIQYNLNKLNSTTFTTVRNGEHRFWAEKKTGVVSQFIQTFTQFQTEASVVGQQSLTGLFEQIKARQVLSHLRELKERECLDIPRFFQEIIPTFGQSPVIVELCQHLSEILSEKIAELTTFTQWFNQPQYQQQQQQMPFDWMYIAQDMQHGPAMLEFFEIEKKLVEMKGLTLASIHYAHLNERLSELEQFVHVIESANKRERCIEKIKTLKALFEEHIEFSPAFVTVPEQYFQHQQKYEKMCQLVGELECHFIECQSTMTTITTGVPTSFFGGVESTTQARFNGLSLIHQKFVRLVQEFQIQFPDCFAPKVDEIVAYLRNVQFNGRRGPAIYGQELKEKLAEFETILSQPECEIACLTTSIFPQSSTSTMKAQRECLKYLIRQVRDLKHQVQYHLNGAAVNTTNNTTGSWAMETLINQHEQKQQIQKLQQQEQRHQQQQQLVEEAALVNLMNKNMWINNNNGENKYFGARLPQQHIKPTTQSTIVEATTTTTSINGGRPTIVKSVSMPVNNGPFSGPFGGLMKPISIEKFIQEQEWFEQQQEQEQQQQKGSLYFPQQGQQQSKVRFATASFELIDECDSESDSESEDFEFGTDAEYTISSLLNQQPTMVRIERNNNGQKWNVESATERFLNTVINGGEQQQRYPFPGMKTNGSEVEECLCQIEKHIRKALNNGSFVQQQQHQQQQTECPLCTVETRTTTTATIGGMRKF